MNKTFERRNFWIGLFAIVLVVGISIFIGYRVGLFLRSLDREIFVTLLVSSTTVGVAVFSAVWERRSGRRLEIEQRIREKKAEVYENFITGMVAFLFSAVEKNQKTSNTQKPNLKKMETEKEGGSVERDAAEFLQQLTPSLMIWASEDVINSWLAIKKRTSTPSTTGSNIEPLYLFEDMVLTMRRDLGHEDKNLSEGRLLSLFINDVEANPRQKLN